MYQLISFDCYKDLIARFKLVHGECADQFVAAVLSWYYHEVEHPPQHFWMKEPENIPPNVFNIVEYTTLGTEPVINLFTESDIHNMMEVFDFDYQTARSQAINLHNNQPENRHLIMLHDIKLVLDGYNFFYCYRDDANDTPKFYNPMVKEVW